MNISHDSQQSCKPKKSPIEFESGDRSSNVDGPHESVEAIESQGSTQPEYDIGPPPDGGLIAWVQVVAGFFAMFNSYGLVNTFGVYQTYYSQNMLADRSPSDISWIGALFGSLSQFAAIVFAPLVDKGYIKQMALTATLIQSFAMMMLSLSNTYWQVMLTQAVLLGLGASLFFLVGIGTVTPYFSRHRGLAIGLAASGSSLGGVIYPIGLARLLRQVGFAWSARIVGFIVLGTGLICFACVKRRLPPRQTGALIDFASFKNKQMVFYSLSMLFAFGAQYMVMFYLQLSAVKVSRGAEVTLYITAILNAASTVGRIVPNIISDHVGVFNVMLPAVCSCAILGYCWIAIDSSGSMVAFAILYGLSSAPFIALQGPIVASMTPDLRKLGIRLGFVSLFTGVGSLVGPPVAGVILRQHGWLWLKILVGCTSTAAFMCALICRQLAVGKNVFVKV